MINIQEKLSSAASRCIRREHESSISREGLLTSTFVSPTSESPATHWSAASVVSNVTKANACPFGMVTLVT